MISLESYARVALLTTMLAFVVITLGAYVRLSGAGLGCPDWPGCYGRISAPQSEEAIRAANSAFVDRPVDPGKARIEMIHRYAAGTLGFLVVLLAVLAWRRRRMPGQQVVLPIALVTLVGFQALLGMWTVTLSLQPVVVVAHLLGGILTIGLLWWLTLRQGRLFVQYFRVNAVKFVQRFRPWVVLALIIVVIQLSLGGWTSANYAALACPDFPTCRGSWWPPMDFAEGFQFWKGFGAPGHRWGLSSEGRVAVQVAHRLGAVVTFVYVGALCICLMRARQHLPLVIAGGVTLALLLTQVSIGIANVLIALPLPLAVTHNGIAALLLLSLVTVYHTLRLPSVSM